MSDIILDARDLAVKRINKIPVAQGLNFRRENR